jgi:hypothetical protein
MSRGYNKSGMNANQLLSSLTSFGNYFRVTGTLKSWVMTACGRGARFLSEVSCGPRSPFLDRLRLADDAGFKPRPFGDQFYRHPSITNFDLGLDSEHARLLSMLRPFCSAAALVASLNCRESAPTFAAKYAKPARISQYFVSKRTGENGLLGIEWRQFAGLSLNGTSAVRFQ